MNRFVCATGMVFLLPGMVWGMAWGTVWAAPLVLGKEPGVISTADYEAFMQRRMTSDQPSVSPATVPQPTQASTAPPMRFPVISKTLTPGVVQRRSLKHGPKQPICLVGSDSRSMAWIRRYHHTLQQVGAVCLIVEAKDHRAAMKVKQALAGIPAYPASADDIAPKLGLHHYPVLLFGAGVEQ